MVEVIRRAYLKKFCKEQGWDYDKLIHNEQFMKEYQAYNKELQDRIDSVVDKVVREAKCKS